ncbi:MAG: DUF397 domain-containing protein [Nocardiopsaceae bacterium]|nr:DUF397 domain-containing protein [Nocardiopsaceae bacterium]
MVNRDLCWIKSSYSGSQGGNCVEVAPNRRGLVLVRDTMDRGGTVLGFRVAPWRQFAAEIKEGCDRS